MRDMHVRGFILKAEVTMIPVRRFSLVFLATAAFLSFNVSAQSAAAPTAVPAAAPDSTVLMRGPAGDVTLGQVRAGVEAIVPLGQREEFFTYPKNIEQMASTIYVYHALNAQAKQQGFDQKPDVAQVLAISQQRALADLWIMRQAKERAPSTEQIEKYARSVYQGQPQKSADGKSLDFESQRTELMAQAREKLTNQIRVDMWNAAQAGAKPDTEAIAAQVRPPAEK